MIQSAGNDKTESRKKLYYSCQVFIKAHAHSIDTVRTVRYDTIHRSTVWRGTELHVTTYSIGESGRTKNHTHQ